MKKLFSLYDIKLWLQNGQNLIITQFIQNTLNCFNQGSAIPDFLQMNPKSQSLIPDFQNQIPIPDSENLNYLLVGVGVRNP